MKAKVLMLSVTSITVTVDIPDDIPADERHEYAVEQAYGNTPPGLCHHCVGYGKSWSRDEGIPDVPDSGPWPPHQSTFTDEEIVTFDVTAD